MRTSAVAIDPGDLQGFGRLAFDATIGLTGVVEAMHHEIARGPLVPGARAGGRTRGITGLVYWSIRGIAGLLGRGLDAALASLGRETGERVFSAKREAVVAALNGVLGDHLAATGNPLAISMRFRRRGLPLPLDPGALAAAIPDAGPRPLVLVHGSCLDDLRWQRRGRDHGAALSRDLGYTPVYLHYNTGLHVSTNGRALAELLEELVQAWPVEVEGLAVVAHSMGGLVTRSACHHAESARHAWRGLLRKVVFLGTPHHGAPLARGGAWVDAAIGVSRYSAPIGRLGRIRSAGVTDLRHGSLLDEDWDGRDRFALSQPPPRAVPLPRGVECYAAAGVRSRSAGRAASLVGDGLVPLDSAFGLHADPARTLAFAESRRWVGEGMGHFDLLDHPAVYDRLRRWLAP